MKIRLRDTSSFIAMRNDDEFVDGLCPLSIAQFIIDRKIRYIISSDMFSCYVMHSDSFMYPFPNGEIIEVDTIDGRKFV